TCFFTLCCFFFSSRRRHTRSKRDWSSDVCSSDLRLEDLYRGWDGLHAGIEIFSRDVLPKLAAGETATYQTWDWHAAAGGEPGPEIGRASCRERVKSAVGAGTV